MRLLRSAARPSSRLAGTALLAARCSPGFTLGLLVLVTAAAALHPAQAQTTASPGDWPRHGRDAAETRFSPLDAITTGNVDQLEVAWSWTIPKRGARLETTPLVVDGVLYGTAAFSFVFALDAATGEEIWQWDPGIPHEDDGGPRTCCGDVNRGVAIDGDLLFVGLLDGRLAALDRHTGSPVWMVQTTPPGADYSITGAPRVVGNAVVIGNGGAEYGVRGYVTAYDAATGEQLWRTHMVPGNPAAGHESEAMRAAAETWTGEWWVAGGGGTVWDGMAVDEEAGLLYVGTGNGSPWNRDNRSPGGGDNLYLSSILALDPADGAILWHYQTTPGDDWDYTATQPLMLLDLEDGQAAGGQAESGQGGSGQARQVIVQAPKNGFFYVVDRLTGEFLSAQAFADDLTWASSVDPETGRPVETPEARYGMTGEPVYLAPGPRGAHNWHPMSWNPEAGLVYIPATNNNYYFEREEVFDYQAGVWNTGTVLGSAAGRRPPRPELTGPPNLLLAWDPTDNREAWRVEAGGGHGGTMSTGGGLVFWGTGRRLAALDARTGMELWSAEVGAGTASPVSYEAGGRQHVAIAAGLVTGGGEPRVWAFALPEDAEPQDRTWTTARPEEVGMSSEGLARIGPAMQALVDDERTGGIMTLVSRRGEIVHWEAQGWRVKDDDPLAPDDIFRIYSMTKPVTSVAAMILVEEGRLSLDQELGALVPGFADAKVHDGAGVRPAARPVLVRDLLTHTSGLTYGIFGDSPVDSMYRELGNVLGTSSGRDLESTVNAFASLPLVDDPGARWNYSVSTDVLGRVVEVASGQPLDVFFRERIFAPLGMDDTGFFVEERNLPRLTAMFARSRQGLVELGPPEADAFAAPPSWFSGGGGLTSTADDFLRFCRMLLGEGEVDGVRIMSPETVRLMVRNHLPDDMIPIMRGIGSQGFGLGFAVEMSGGEGGAPAADAAGLKGAYWWTGIANTYFWVDPEEELVVLAWTQLQPYGAAPLNRVIRPLVYGAIERP